MNDRLLEVKNIFLSYDDKPQAEKCFLKDISFNVSPGKVCCLMGANGCGKTTLINCILGMHRPISGTVLASGEDVFGIKASSLAKRISYVPQIHDRTFPYTVEQVVMMGRTVYSSMISGPGQEERENVRKALSMAGIEHLAERPYTQISGGEMQLVMLARALAQNAPLIIMDEPGSHLDFRNELILMETTAGLVKQGQATVLMATHSPDQPFFFERQGVDTEVIAIAGASVAYTGKPSEVLTEERIEEIYHVRAKLLKDGDIVQIAPVSTIS